MKKTTGRSGFLEMTRTRFDLKEFDNIRKIQRVFERVSLQFVGVG